MQRNTAQLDIFDSTVDAVPPAVASESLTQTIDDPAPAANEEDEPTLCLSPSAGIRECRECWERHPELWARYITRANCVKHTR